MWYRTEGSGGTKVSQAHQFKEEPGGPALPQAGGSPPRSEGLGRLQGSHTLIQTLSEPRGTTKPGARVICGLPAYAPPGTRTPNLLIKSQLLCQLS